jgi:2-iminobutanoate/2-iminopropanoate deaminase
MRENLHSTNLVAPKFKYTPCVKTGPFYHFSGMVGLDPKTGKMATGGVYGESATILANMRLFAAELKLNLSHLASTRIYTTKMDEFPEINRAWEEVFTGDVIPPARTSIGVAALPVRALVEMEFMFYRPE